MIRLSRRCGRLGGVGVRRGIVACEMLSLPELLVSDPEQGSHVGEAGGDDSDGGLDAGPDAGADFVICGH